MLLHFQELYINYIYIYIYIYICIYTCIHKYKHSDFHLLLHRCISTVLTLILLTTVTCVFNTVEKHAVETTYKQLNCRLTAPTIAQCYHKAMQRRAICASCRKTSLARNVTVESMVSTECLLALKTILTKTLSSLAYVLNGEMTEN